jgi:N-methylhydantoinase B
MNYIIRAGGPKELYPSKFHSYLHRGDRFIHDIAGAGGWGDPLARDVWRVVKDVRNEFVSQEAARARYGVVVSADGRTVDEAATEALRARLRAARGWAKAPFLLREEPVLMQEAAE